MARTPEGRGPAGGHGGRPAAALGFRRIALVRAWVGPAGSRYEVDGVVHRYPVTRAVSAGIASRLVASGVPLVCRADRGGEGLAPC